MEPPLGTQSLIDTDVLIDVLQGAERAKDFFSNEYVDDVMTTSVISSMELLRGSRTLVELRSTRDFINTLQVLPIGETISLRAQDLIDTYYLSHGLDIPDALIAATAMEYRMVLFTRNVRHFQMITGLDVRRPYHLSGHE